MDKYNMIQEMELNFQAINGSESNLWVYDMLGFIYAHLKDEQILDMLQRSKKVLWEHQQYQNARQELEYELSEDK